MTNKVILMIGTSGSGKSTWIRSINTNNQFEIISADEMRIEFTGDINDKSKDKEIYATIKERAIESINNNKSIIIDSTNLQKERRRDFINSIREAVPNVIIEYKLMDLNSKLAKQRIKYDLQARVKRSHVSDATIDRHAESYIQMLQDIKEEDIKPYEE